METVPQGISVAVLARFVDIATDALSGAREEIDALNVYPVPDGDTGTNMFLTVSAARDALHDALEADPDLALDAAVALVVRAALMGARGNSGVILSQMLRGFGLRLIAPEGGEARGETWARALAAGTDASYEAVGVPVEGTILSVARAASDSALASAGPNVHVRDVVVAAAAAARAALERTPEQLPLLAAAGVVDAGGRGLCVILDAVETLSTGRRPVDVPGAPRRPSIPVAHVDDHDLTEDGPAYEVMYLLDAPDPSIPDLRTKLAGLGDSLVVVGGEGLWNVHVHVDDVGAAIEAGIEAGRPYRVKVTHFAEQVADARRRAVPRAGRRVVAVAAGPGLERLYAEAGAVVVPGGPGRRPSTGQLLEAITACGASEVVVLPNDAETVRAAEIAAHTAAEENDLDVEVIATSAQVQGLAALAVHEPGRAFDADVREMTATARHVRHGAVTVAVKQAITTAGPCEPGDVLGVVAGDFALVGRDLPGVAEEIVERLLAGGGELVTLVSGADGEELTAALAAVVEERHPTVDVLTYEGGQERYPLLVSVE
jgi:DAK2 domain fusion protein YloV